MTILRDCPEHQQSLVIRDTVIGCPEKVGEKPIPDEAWNDTACQGGCCDCCYDKHEPDPKPEPILCAYSIPLPPDLEMQAAGMPRLWEEGS